MPKHPKRSNASLEAPSTCHKSDGFRCHANPTARNESAATSHKGKSLNGATVTDRSRYQTLIRTKLHQSEGRKNCPVSTSLKATLYKPDKDRRPIRVIIVQVVQVDGEPSHSSFYSSRRGFLAADLGVIPTSPNHPPQKR